MISEESFLRRIPLAYETKGRMELEAIAFAIDAIYLRHNQIFKWAANCDEDTFLKTPHRERLELFLNLWSIVDQVDILRRLLKPLKVNEGISDFFKIIEPVSDMRNAMDHLPGKINNLADKKGRITPIYGVFSFGKPTLDTNGIAIEYLEIYTMTAGSLTHKSHKWSIATPLPGKIIDIPVGMFEFSAFDTTLDISALVRSLSLIVHMFDTKVRPKMEAKIRSAAKEQGLDAEKIISESSGSIATILRLKLEYNEETNKSETLRIQT